MTIHGHILRMAAAATTPPGQVLFDTSSDPGSPAEFTWTVPQGVFSISVVIVGPGGGAGTSAIAPGTANAARLFIDDIEVLWASGGGVMTAGTGSPIGGDIGGGNGGASTSGNSSRPAGGGGAGGYSGDGGSSTSGAGQDGSGGGGGAGGRPNSSTVHGGTGGGVGLLGQGSNGAGGQATILDLKHGGAGSGGNGKDYGGGRHGTEVNNYRGGAGGSLRYRNNIPVIPGQTVLVTFGPGVGNRGDHAGLGGARIIWPGDERQFPSTRTGDE